MHSCIPRSPSTPHGIVRTASVAVSMTSTDDALYGAQKILVPTAAAPLHFHLPWTPHGRGARTAGSAAPRTARLDDGGDDEAPGLLLRIKGRRAPHAAGASAAPLLRHAPCAAGWVAVRSRCSRMTRNSHRSLGRSARSIRLIQVIALP